jgi:RimJ/RimL family protein N-acetyltransferase
MQFKPLSLADMEQIRQWRNEVPETLRTPFLLTQEQQEDYYRITICDRRSTTRYWGFWDQVRGPDVATPPYSHPTEVEAFIGYGGIENIEWENRCGEISVLIAPDFRGKGYGEEAVGEILRRAFCELNLENVHGECYYSSPAEKFWEKLILKYMAYKTMLPSRKFCAGRYYDSLYFNFARRSIYPDV